MLQAPWSHPFGSFPAKFPLSRRFAHSVVRGSYPTPRGCISRNLFKSRGLIGSFVEPSIGRRVDRLKMARKSRNQCRPDSCLWLRCIILSRGQRWGSAELHLDVNYKIGARIHSMIVIKHRVAQFISAKL